MILVGGRVITPKVELLRFFRAGVMAARYFHSAVVLNPELPELARRNFSGNSHHLQATWEVPVAHHRLPRLVFTDPITRKAVLLPCLYGGDAVVHLSRKWLKTNCLTRPTISFMLT